IIDPEPFIPPDVIDLALWVGEYYASGPGTAVALAMPPVARTGARESFRTTRVYESGEAPAAGSKITARQQTALDALAGHPAGASSADLAKAGVSAATL